jgi:Tfp pilus assembly protein PilX
MFFVAIFCTVGVFALVGYGVARNCHGPRGIALLVALSTLCILSILVLFRWYSLGGLS